MDAGRSIANRMINAPAETITDKPSFRRLVESRGCLVPADGLYEWRRDGVGKVPVWFYLKKTVHVCQRLGCVAAVAGRGRGYTAHFHNCYDCAARRINHRMPVILDELKQSIGWIRGSAPAMWTCRGACAVCFRADGLLRCLTDC
jgi:SOS response associated peptidase (SRAP)